MLKSRLSAKGRGLLRIAATRVAFGMLHVSIFFGATISRAQSSPQKLPILTHAEEVRRLSPEEAAKGYPVRIRGVITMDAPAPDFFVQDSTAGIYAEGSGSPRFSHSLGELVEVEGITGPASSLR